MEEIVQYNNKIDNRKEENSYHLDGKFSPILAAIEDNANISTESKKAISDIQKNGSFVNYLGPDDENSSRKGFFGVISKCDEKSKYSIEYFGCTGIIVSGVDKNTGRQISLMTHNPSDISDDKDFEQGLLNSFEELATRSLPGSIDAVIFGGRADNLNDNPHEDSAKFLTKLCKRALNLEPIILTGPNLLTNRYEIDIHPLDEQRSAEEKEYVSKIKTDVYFDTEHRRLYILRQKQENDKLNEPFMASNYSEQKKRWEDAQ